MDYRWERIEKLIRHMCQVAHDNGPVAAKALIDEMMLKVEGEYRSAVLDEIDRGQERFRKAMSADQQPIE